MRISYEDRLAPFENYFLGRADIADRLTKNSDRDHGFSHGEEIMYYWSNVDSDRTTIGFGSNLITRWLRTVTTNYIQLCRDESVTPAENLDASLLTENNLKDRWSKL